MGFKVPTEGCGRVDMHSDGVCLIDTPDLEESVRRTRDAPASLEVQDRGIKDTRAALRAHGYRQSAKRPSLAALNQMSACAIKRPSQPLHHPTRALPASPFPSRYHPDLRPFS